MIRCIVPIALSCWMAAASAADWDHDANIDAAVVDIVSTWKLGGSTGMEKLVGGCYESIPSAQEPDDRLRRLEYCAGMDLAAVRLTRAVGSGESAGYFSADQVLDRVGRLAAFISDPGVGNQIVRAWSRASAEALERQGF